MSEEGEGVDDVNVCAQSITIRTHGQGFGEGEKEELGLRGCAQKEELGLRLGSWAGV